MKSDGETPAEGERRCRLPSVKACPLPEGNATEFPFPLSIHGAWMLQQGIEEYARDTRRMHEEGVEDASYCLLRTGTAMAEAKKLRAWAEQVDAQYLGGTIQDLDALLAELAAERDRFIILVSQEAARRGG
jgi:hypothetical protein